MAPLHERAMPIGKFCASAERLGARAQGVVRVDERRQTVTSVDPTDARKATVRRFGRSDRSRQRTIDESAGSSNPVAPTILRKKRFGENVEGLVACEGAELLPEYRVQTEQARWGDAPNDLRNSIRPRQFQQFKSRRQVEPRSKIAGGTGSWYNRGHE